MNFVETAMAEIYCGEFFCLEKNGEGSIEISPKFFVTICNEKRKTEVKVLVNASEIQEKGNVEVCR